MGKFLKVCWEKDKLSGEANFNIHNDFEANTLFYDPANTNKKTKVKKELEELILSGKIIDNITGLKFTLQMGCEPVIFTEIIKELDEKKMIERLGEVNNSSSNIHKVKKYYIKTCSNENN